jgi:hypothetical protein
MEDPLIDRRTVLAGMAGGGVASLAGCSFFQREDDAETTTVDTDQARSLAEQFAPTLYFDRNEEWYPTDPRPYESEQDEGTVVDGFDALNGYVENGGSDDPPDPRAFYHVRQYEESSLAVVQYWFYSVFDQFATNFHWHDWELLQVFVDTETEEPQLIVASAHSRSVPNNEFLDPDPDRQPRLLVELGSHSSGLSVNGDAERFQRFPLDGDIADITNSVVDGLEDVVTIPLAYGLPRDEGLRLPYAVPELDGEPLTEHDRLPLVESSDLISEELTISSFDDLRSPPTDLPERETSNVFAFERQEGEDVDLTYDLVPTAELEHIEEFTGPQLSFEFRIPDFAEDLIAGHITTTGVPWKSTRYDNPAADISGRRHRQALSDRYDAIGEPSPFNQVIAKVTNAVSSDDAPDGEGLTISDSPLEMFALLQSEPEAVPTFQGVAVLQDVPEGEHTLTINGAGVEPHSETVTVSGENETTVAGVDGEIPVVARENATKLEVDPSEADSELTALAVEDDFAGRLYDAPLSGPDAVYVHRGGAFTTELRDSDDELGAVRVNPSDEERVRIDNPRTGKESLATYLADLAEETSAQVAAVSDSDDDDDDGTGRDSGGQQNAVQGLATALGAVADAARNAAEAAQAGNRGNADQRLEAVATRLERVETRLSEARGSLPEPVANANDRRLEQARRRTEQARAAEKL